MATSAPNHTPDPRPTGDLEQLFRQKFAEAEVTPRAGLWEQLDHELLVEQNDTYRRRLGVHRWVAAACLLLLLSVSGWAVLRKWQTPAPDLAAQRTVGPARNAAPRNQPGSAATKVDASGAATGAKGESIIAGAPAGAANELLAVENGNALEPGSLADQIFEVEASRNQTTTTEAAHRGRSRAVAGYQAAGPAGSMLRSSDSYFSGRSGTEATQFGGAYPTAGSATSAGWYGLAPRFAGLRGGWLGGRPDTLKASLLAVPQPAIGTLAATADQTQTAAKQWRRLRLGGSYAAAAYNPNINFSRNDGRVKADLVTNALRNYYQDDAETEYRRNLRAGLSQRVAVTAAYVLHKRWTLTSGVEVTQQRATSATSYDFLDGRQVSREVADLFSSAPGYQPSALAVAPADTRKTSYRYRTVAVPVQIRYGSARSGISLYAKVGAAVGLLLSSRSELAGAPTANRPSSLSSKVEATRVYSLSSKDSPYRQVQTSVRGGAGVRYQPAQAGWSVMLGPTTELGLTTLNANPSQRIINQSRPYSVGVEASVEFGTPKPIRTAH